MKRISTFAGLAGFALLAACGGPDTAAENRAEQLEEQAAIVEEQADAAPTEAQQEMLEQKAEAIEQQAQEVVAEEPVVETVPAETGEVDGM